MRCRTDSSLPMNYRVEFRWLWLDYLILVRNFCEGYRVCEQSVQISIRALTCHYGEILGLIGGGFVALKLPRLE